LSRRKSSGVRIVSRSGVLLNAVTALFQSFRVEINGPTGNGLRKNLAPVTQTPDATDGRKARSIVFGVPRIVQCDLHHPRRFHPADQFIELFEALGVTEARRASAFVSP
jgi:hypothetical protein